MAREAGWTSYDSQDERFKALVALVRADERALAAPVQPETDSCGSGAGCLYKVAMIENLESEVERLKAAQRQWVGLTDEERTEIRREHYARTLPLMDAVEAKLRSKNT